MPSKIRILIVDDNEDFSDILFEYLSYQETFEIVGLASNGLEALDFISNEEIDLVLLDIIMPNLDGLGVLEKVNSIELKSKPLFIVMSALGQEKITTQAISLGATFFLIKPFDLATLVDRIIMLVPTSKSANVVSPQLQQQPILAHQPTEASIHSKTSSLLNEMGIPSHLKGYQYLLDAICLVTEDFSLINSVVKKLYPAIADKHNTQAANVERAMRNTIETALNRGAATNINAALNYDFIKENTKVTNSEFIARVADQIRFR